MLRPGLLLVRRVLVPQCQLPLQAAITRWVPAWWHAWLLVSPLILDFKATLTTVKSKLWESREQDNVTIKHFFKHTIVK
jgi:hypothetical protein